MEADWEIEIGPGAPIIDTAWPGRIDLELEPWRVEEIVEVINLPTLAQGLVMLNSKESHFFTSKCDIWALGADELPDPDECDAQTEEVVAGTACYIDVVRKTMHGHVTTDSSVRAEDRFIARLNDAKSWATQLVKVLRQSDLRCARVDLVLRSCRSGGSQPENDKNYEVAMSAYISACGPDAQTSNATLGLALTTFANALPLVIIGDATGAPAPTAETIQ